MHKTKIFVTFLLNLPGTENSLAVSINKNTHDQLRIVCILTQVTIVILYFGDVNLSKNVIIDETLMVLWQNIEHI